MYILSQLIHVHTVMCTYTLAPHTHTHTCTLTHTHKYTVIIDPERRSCSAAEEHWSEDMGDSQEYVESPFIPGSLVWAKMDGYPW